MNYGEFYGLLAKLPGVTDGQKEDFVRQFTNGRTIHVSEMKVSEYRAMCASMRGRTSEGMTESALVAELKRRRSAVLKRMQQLGIDTTNWAHVDNFCMNKKIAGKRFAKLTKTELTDLIPKLESMLRKNGTQRISTPIGLLSEMKKMSWS